MINTAPTLFFAGFASNTRQEGAVNKIEVSGFETMLQNKTGMTVQYNCPKRFGTRDCGVLPDSAPRFVAGVNSTGTTITLQTAPPLPLSRYQYGSVRVLNGPFAGLEYEIDRFLSSTVLEIKGTRLAMNLTGHAVLISTGCKKTYASCLENGNDRFWGFPSVPGSVFAYSASEAITVT
jgi:hypothetical protein